jgi:signal transduction histidine kinase
VIRRSSRSRPPNITLDLNLGTDSGEPLVFEKFYRAGGGEGAGLGLYICRALVEEHGGRIVAESAPEKGTRIRFWLPTGEISEAGG